MLPMMILQPSDIASFDTSLDSSNLLPQQARQPSAAFADILEIGLDTAITLENGDGMALPLPGKELPQELPVVATEVTAEPINALVQLLEPARADAPLTQANPVQVTPAAIGSGQAGAIAAPQVELTADMAAARGAQLTVNGNPAGVLTDSNVSPADQQILRDAAANAARTPLPAPQPAVVPGRSAGEIVSHLPAAPVTAAVSAASLGNKSVPDRKPGLDAQLMRPADAPALQGGEDMHTEIARDLRVQAGTTPGAQVLQSALNTTNPLEMPVGQQAQLGAVATAQAPTLARSEAPAAAMPLTQAIDIPVKDAAWGDRIGERVLLMASNRLQSAEIRLTPAELGPLRVQIALDDGAANVTFLAQHAVTRDALEQALPRLRELLAENGLTLNQASIGEHAEQGVQHGGKESADDNAAAARIANGSEDDPGVAELAGAQPAGRSDSLVDTFA